MGFETYWFCFIFSSTVNFLTLTYAMVLNGMYEEATSFVGLSLDVQDVTKRRCTARCVYPVYNFLTLHAKNVKIIQNQMKVETMFKLFLYILSTSDVSEKLDEGSTSRLLLVNFFSTQTMCHKTKESSTIRWI